MQPISEMSFRDLEWAIAREVMRANEEELRRYGAKQYTDSLFLADMVEAEIERRGLVHQYIVHLAALVLPMFDGSFSLSMSGDMFAFRRATPRQVAEAALAAVREAKP